MRCEDCGEKVYEGFCTNCDEDHFIAEQIELDCHAGFESTEKGEGLKNGA